MSPIFHKTKHALKAEKKLIKKLNYKIINNKIIIIKPPSTTPPPLPKNEKQKTKKKPGTKTCLPQEMIFNAIYFMFFIYVKEFNLCKCPFIFMYLRITLCDGLGIAVFFVTRILSDPLFLLVNFEIESR